MLTFCFLVQLRGSSILLGTYTVVVLLMLCHGDAGNMEVMRLVENREH